MQTALIIPTLNAGSFLSVLLPALRNLSPQPDEVLFVDSSSDDDTVKKIVEAGFRAHVIPRKSFGHGKTRNFAASLVEADILIYLTQDVLPSDTRLIAEIVSAFGDPLVAHVYVRQLPHNDATIAARFSRRFNYPAISLTTNFGDIEKLGIRAFRSSNACAAYRRTIFEQVGGFPENVPVSEDTFVAARMILAGASSRYLATTAVKHSHNYTFKQEFQRYFDIGAAHDLMPWYSQLASNVGNEGRRYLTDEFWFLVSLKRYDLLVDLFCRNGLRWLGYRIGRLNGFLPDKVCRKLAMSSHHWSLRKGGL